jgi:uncharacterized membrane protein YjgN (DUF898 family)
VVNSTEGSSSSVNGRAEGDPLRTPGDTRDNAEKTAMHHPLPLSSVPHVPAPKGIVFTGERPEFRKLVTRGAWLELITLGFYRFWLATDMRRHLWSHTAVGGDHAEYTGTPKELLIGFLVALAILMPVYIAYTLLGLEAERIQAFASVPMFSFIYLFTQFALYRARRYRLSRTVWRGVRFWMNGSGWSYAWRASLWALAVLFSLGLALPWRAAALERFKMKHTYYGNLQGEFVGKGSDFFKQAWWLWLLCWPCAIFIFPLPFIYAIFKAIEWRWWVNGMRMGEGSQQVRFESDLDFADLMGLYWKLIGWAALLFVALSFWAGGVAAVGAAVTKSAAGAEKFALAAQHPVVLIGLGLGYLVFALAFNVVFRIYLLRDLWKKIVETTVVHNLAAADNVVAEGDAVNAIGEGFADSLDVGGF